MKLVGWRGGEEDAPRSGNRSQLDSGILVFDCSLRFSEYTEVSVFRRWQSFRLDRRVVDPNTASVSLNGQTLGRDARGVSIIIIESLRQEFPP